VWWPIVTVMLGVSDRSIMGVLLSSFFEIPRRFDKCPP
jgi:hypothetical protein